MRIFDLVGRSVVAEGELVRAVLDRTVGSEHWTLQSDDPLEVFSSVLAAFLSGRKLTILDRFVEQSNLPERDLGSEPCDRSLRFEREAISTIEEILEGVSMNGSDGSITLLTSGTTGKPTVVEHGISTLLKGVKIGEDYQRKCWGLAFNPSHIAGIQVFLQAVWNDSDLVQLFGVDPHIAVQRIQDRRISHLSATPSYFRLLLPSLESVGPISGVQRVTCGGEKFDPILGERLKEFFPNARINNIYASTEGGTLLVSQSDRFRIPDSQARDFRVLDGRLQFRMQTSTNFLGREWYDSGDRVEVLQENPLEFRFIGREADNVSVGGYNVNVSAVEDVLLSHPAVAQGRVYARKNSLLGNVLVAEYVATKVDVSEKEMRAFFVERVEQHEVPRKIDKVDHLKLSRSGKIER
ncbi:MAG: AMP-binding protein [Verrucomicrobiota bacterium]